jgi:hypothetical protein
MLQRTGKHPLHVTAKSHMVGRSHTALRDKNKTGSPSDLTHRNRFATARSDAPAPGTTAPSVPALDAADNAASARAQAALRPASNTGDNARSTMLARRSVAGHCRTTRLQPTRLLGSMRIRCTDGRTRDCLRAPH